MNNDNDEESLHVGPNYIGERNTLSINYERSRYRKDLFSADYRKTRPVKTMRSSYRGAGWSDRFHSYSKSSVKPVQNITRLRSRIRPRDGQQWPSAQTAGRRASDGE